MRITAITRGAEGLSVVGIDTNEAPMQLDGIDQIICETGQRPALDMTSELRLALDSPLESTAALGELIDPNLHSCAAGLVAGGACHRLVLPVLADPGRGASHPDMANHPLLFHSSLLTAPADVGLCALSLAAGCWVLMETGSVLSSVWSLGLVQAACALLPTHLGAARSAANIRTDAERHFARAARAAEQALQALSSPR